MLYHYKKLVLRATNNDICPKCHKERPYRTNNVQTLSNNERKLAVTNIQNANQTKLKIMEDIPARLRRLWGQCVTSVLDRLAHAKTDDDAFKAYESWAKLKSVLVLPIRGGYKKQHTRTRFHRRQMTLWIAGNTEDCWTNALAIERERASKRRNSRKNKQHDQHNTGAIDRRTNERLTADKERRHMRVKRLVNHGEWSKAMGALLSNGTADITGNILAELRKKHPPRNNPIVHPGLYPGWSQLTEDTNLYIEKDPNSKP